MSSKIYNEDFEVGQKFRGMVNGAILTVVEVRIPGVDYPMMASSGIPYVDRVREKTIYFEDQSGRVSKCGFETAKRLMLERMGESMMLNGFEKVYGLVLKARTAKPVDTETLDNIRDTYGYDLYKEALDVVLAKLEDYAFVMEKYVAGSSYGDMRLTEQDGVRFVLEYNGKKAAVEFDPQWPEYVYTVNGKGPFSHSSYEFIGQDVREVLEMEEKTLAARLVDFYKDYDLYDYMDNKEIGQTDEDVAAEIESQLTDEKMARAILASLLEFKEEGPVEDMEVAVLDGLIQDMKDVIFGNGKPLSDVLDTSSLSFDDLGLSIGFQDGSVGHSNNFYRYLLSETGIAPLRERVDDLIEDASTRSEAAKSEKVTVDILQVKRGDAYRDFRFAGSGWLKGGLNAVDVKNYARIYQYSSEKAVDFKNDSEVYPFLEAIFTKFNLRHPEDFKGCSMTTSDVVILSKGKEVKAFFCDSIGFKALPDKFVKDYQMSQAKEQGLDR